MHKISMACKVIAFYDLLTITKVIFFVSVFLAIRHLLVPGVPRVPVWVTSRVPETVPNFLTFIPNSLRIPNLTYQHGPKS
jgi:hypothetical protein